MKKWTWVLVLLMVLSVSVWAEMDMGSFPLGQWRDGNYNAFWNFSSGNITITLADGTVAYDFSDKTIEKFEVKTTTEGLVLSFDCKENGRSYSFIKGVTSLDLRLEMVKSNGKTYQVTMPFQK